MIQHVGLEVAETAADEEVAFWSVLGFEEVVVGAAVAGHSRWVERDGFQIHLQFVAAPVVPAVGHVAVVVAGYEAVVAALVAAGFGHEPRAEHWAAARGFTRSPAGHVVELMAAPPAPREARSS